MAILQDRLTYLPLYARGLYASLVRSADICNGIEHPTYEANNEEVEEDNYSDNYDSEEEEES